MMDRKEFLIKILGLSMGLAGLSSFRNLSESLKENGYKMPVLFIGHGSPMNGIEQNEFTENWSNIVHNFPTPQMVLVVSAHWLTKGTGVTAMNQPKTIHDFGGFPQELFNVQYPAPGSQIYAEETAHLIQGTEVFLDHDWGLDHGTWTVVRHMYPEANIPVLQLSIDYTKGPEYHYQLAQELQQLRKKGVLIIGSGNMVHNLRMVAWNKLNDKFGFDWALDASEFFKKSINNQDHKSLIEYYKQGQAVQLAVPTPDHYYPLLYTLGMSDNKDEIRIFNDEAVAGSLTMTCVQFG